MPAKAFVSIASTSTGLDTFRAAPVVVALVTVLITFLMFSIVSSRPCSALSVASATALRRASPCLAVAAENMLMSASWSIPDLIILGSSCGCSRASPLALLLLHVLSAVDRDVGAGQERGLF